MLRVAMRNIPPLGIMARKPSATPPMEIIDIDMNTMDWDYLKNKQQPALIIGETGQRRVLRPPQQLDGFSTGLQIVDSQRNQPQWEVEKDEKITDE